MIIIDGSYGEGGGQILRTSLSLAAITGTAFRMDNIRAGRLKPGLMRQHLTCCRAVADICGGELIGDEPSSSSLQFTPGRIRGGEYHFSIGTAGNVLLLAQAILPVLLFADRPSTAVLEGGTYTEQAPAFDFFSSTFIPCLHRMGLDIQADMECPGFYPVGGGRIRLSVIPAKSWNIFSLRERGELKSADVLAIGSRIKEKILLDELGILASQLAGKIKLRCGCRCVESPGPGNVLIAFLKYDNITEVFSECGSYGKSRSKVASSVAGQISRYIEGGWAADRYLADQLMLPMALGAGGGFVTGPPSLHADTNRIVIRRFIDGDIKFNEINEGLYEMEVVK